jgi:hypothetical protein
MFAAYFPVLKMEAASSFETVVTIYDTQTVIYKVTAMGTSNLMNLLTIFGNRPEENFWTYEKLNKRRTERIRNSYFHGLFFVAYFTILSASRSV